MIELQVLLIIMNISALLNAFHIRLTTELWLDTAHTLKTP